jgi:iron complex outermembrane receptor protein
LAIAAISVPVQAEQLTLEEVVVTAQKRVESLQDVPISIVAISGDKIEK